MTIARTLLLLGLVAACDKPDASAKPDKPNVTAVDKPSGADPACTAKLSAFQSWLQQLELERRSYEVDFGYKLVVIDRAPMPVPQHVDAVTIRKTSIEAYDVGEHNHVGGGPGEHATQQAVVDRLKQMRSMVAGKDEFDPAPDDLLRVDIDEKALWGDVARVVDAATKAGYARAVFALSATSKLEKPAGVEPWTMTEAAVKDASTKLEAFQTTCKPWGSAGLRHERKANVVEDAAATAKETTAALAACSCAVNPDEARSVIWKEARWHQATPRVGVTIALAGGAAKTVVLPATTPWSDAAAKLAEAAPDGAAPAAVNLVAK